MAKAAVPHTFHVSVRGSLEEQTAVSLFISPSVPIFFSDGGLRRM